MNSAAPRPRRLRVYLAAPLFTPAEREANLQLAKALEAHVDVYLPQRDGILLADELRLGRQADEVCREIYSEDSRAILNADFIVAVLSGPAIDDGVAFELGLAVGAGRPCIGLANDVRRKSPYFQNPMLLGAVQRTFETELELLGWIRSRALEWEGRSDPK
jgi:nucleoside 2-deoxyribosyltransferase